MDINLKKTPATEFTVQGVTLSAPQPYAEGHVLQPNEAAVLNQVFVENLRNNFAKTVKTNIEQAGSPESVNVDELQAQLNEYIGHYEFGVRRSAGGGTRTIDPVEKRARELARRTIVEAIKAQGYKVSDIPTDKKNELIDQLLSGDNGETIRAQAKAQVDAERNLATQSISLDLAA